MIEVGLEFNCKVGDVLDAFLTLPSPLRPTHFSREEKIKNYGNIFQIGARLSKFIEKSKSGFFLLGAGVTYSVRFSKDRSVICDCFIDVASLLAKQFLIFMSKAKPLFGFACALEERKKRNRVTIQLGQNEIESWVGRDLKKYVPGFYWITLLPDSLAKLHALPLDAVCEVAEECIDLNFGQHLYRFYPSPEDWIENAPVEKLCKGQPGVFDVEKILPKLSGAKNFLELSSMLKNWR